MQTVIKGLLCQTFVGFFGFRKLAAMQLRVVLQCWLSALAAMVTLHFVLLSPFDKTLTPFIHELVRVYVSDSLTAYYKLLFSLCMWTSTVSDDNITHPFYCSSVNSRQWLLCYNM